jgi:glycosyltransferase involved in cell wall biosynthesis
MPKVTIAINTYNRENLLKYAINGVLSQTFLDFELLILDNGSNDNTLSVVSAFSDNRISYIKNHFNSRSFYNYAFFIAKGEFLIITHDDDIMDHDMIENQIKIMHLYPNVSCVSTNARQIDLYDKILDENENYNYDQILSKNEYLSFFLNEKSICAPTVMFRLDFFRTRNLLFKHDIAGLACDQYLWFKTLEYDTNIYIISKKLYSQRVHNKQDSVENGLNMNIELLFVFLKEISNLTNENNQELTKMVVHKIYYYLTINKKLNIINYSNNELINLFNNNYKNDHLINKQKLLFLLFIKFNTTFRLLKKLKITN